MKKFIISALVLMAGSLLFTSCTSVPQDTPRQQPATTTVPQDNK
jgi:starvation-inducible outer membrane lipoprotein